ncbi:DHA2 family efflux MFS transporter permease subunit [Daeguia caeni]|uniref:DHA2 family efflux MFS transporter permease subunit n=1 Tax=Daeguia caeni TaxID=439612 RepID=A0ABV9H312_9HYPH
MSADTPIGNAAPALPGKEESVDIKKAIGFMAMVFGMFMAILDIQIVSASLAEIQAGLGASSDEISWVQTSYLIAEVIMIPLSGFLGRLLSTRVLFSLSAAGFTIASILCATASSINEMIVYRAIQGFIGGGMIPSVFAAAFTIFPPSKRSVVSPMIGLVATMAPTVGPTIGGYLSHTFSWHWLFLVNVGPGIIVTIACWNLIDFDKGDKSLLDKFDWWGLLGMAAFLGSLEFVLEEGPQNDWFEDEYILIMSIVLLIGALVFFYRVFTAEQPIVEFQAFRNINFSFGSLFSFVMGVGLYGLTYLYPLYLGSVRGYDSLMIGEALFVSGLAMFFTAPVAGFLSARMDPRLMMMIGFIGFAAGTWMVTGLTKDWDFDELLVPQILRGCSLMICMVPINNIALGTLPPQMMKGASGLFNLMRNLGGAVGLAVINTLLTERRDLHYARLAEHVRWGNPEAESLLAKLTAKYNSAGLDGATIALKKLSGMVLQQATLLSFIDVFHILTLMFVSLAVLAMLVKKPPDNSAGAGSH